MQKNDITDILNNLKTISKVSYLTTVNEDGFPETRAMLNIHNPEMYPHLKKTLSTKDDSLYFSTNTSSSKINHIKSNVKASVYFINSSEFLGLLLTGTIEEINDASAKDAFWDKTWEVYYRGGKDGGDFSILKFTPLSYKYYDGRFNVFKGSFN